MLNELNNFTLEYPFKSLTIVKIKTSKIIRRYVDLNMPVVFVKSCLNFFWLLNRYFAKNIFYSFFYVFQSILSKIEQKSKLLHSFSKIIVQTLNREMHTENNIRSSLLIHLFGNILLNSRLVFTMKWGDVLTKLKLHSSPIYQQISSTKFGKSFLRKRTNFSVVF